MERQEEEEKRSPSSKAATFLPLDLDSEVLIRLPGKSIARSRCVSKLWSSCTTLARFNKSFTARSLQNPCLLIFAIEGDNLVGFSLPQQGNSDKSCCSPVDSFVMKYPEYCRFNLTANSANGLYSFQRTEGLVIWNPTIRQFSTFNKPESCWDDSAGYIGYDPIDGTYKALTMPLPFVDYEPNTKNRYHPRVLTLGKSQESSWRFIQGSFEHFPYRRGRCINGVLYYEAFLESECVRRIMISFHVRSEKFNMIQVPWRRSRGHLFAYKGKLVSLASRTEDAFISMWVLEDAESHDWSFRRFSIPFPLEDPISQTFLQLKDVTDAGEFVYVPTTLLGPFHVLYFDPERNNFRRVIYQGVAEDEFRCRHGLGNGRLHAIHTYPNHIESLISM